MSIDKLFNSRLTILPIVCIMVPIIVMYMFIRHPIMVWREARKSWRLVNGIDDDDYTSLHTKEKET
jgi:hypothetical protein